MKIQISEINRMKKLAGIIKESYNYNDTGEELANFLNKNQAEVERKINRPDLILKDFIPYGDMTPQGGVAVNGGWDPPQVGVILSFDKERIEEDYDDIESIEVQGKTIYYYAFHN